MPNGYEMFALVTVLSGLPVGAGVVVDPAVVPELGAADAKAPVPAEKCWVSATPPTRVARTMADWATVLRILLGMAVS